MLPATDNMSQHSEERLFNTPKKRHTYTSQPERGRHIHSQLTAAGDLPKAQKRFIKVASAREMP